MLGIIFVFIFLTLMLLLKVNPFATREKLIQMDSIMHEAKRDMIVGKPPNKLDRMTRGFYRQLRLAGISPGAFTLITVCIFIIGFAAGMFLLLAPSLALTLGVAATTLPFLLVLVRARDKSEQESEGLEALMSNVTHAYISSNNIITAFEGYSAAKHKGLDPILHSIGPVEEFIIDVHTIDPSVENALRKLQSKINNRFFDDWISMLILCQSNRELMFSLQPIIKSFNQQKIMQMEAQTSLKMVWLEYVTLVGLALGFLLALRSLYEVWFNIMVYTVFGRALFALLVFTIIGTSFYMLRVTRPLE